MGLQRRELGPALHGRSAGRRGGCGAGDLSSARLLLSLAWMLSGAPQCPSAPSPARAGPLDCLESMSKSRYSAAELVFRHSLLHEILWTDSRRSAFPEIHKSGL